MPEVSYAACHAARTLRKILGSLEDFAIGLEHALGHRSGCEPGCAIAPADPGIPRLQVRAQGACPLAGVELTHVASGEAAEQERGDPNRCGGDGDVTRERLDCC